MNTKELLEKIARYKSAMEAETDADTKKKFQSRIDQLEKDIAQVESAVEKQEEKLEKQEDKALEEAEKKLQRYKDAMDAESDPDTKAKFKKRIDDLEKQLKGVKEQIKEEKKEIEEQKKDIKDAVQDVQSAQKTVRTQAIKKAGQQVVARKATTTKKKTRKKAIANIITKLDKLIDKNPALKAKYKGARGGSYMQYPSVDLKRDAGRASKPFGYRFKGDNTKVPRPDQRGQSNVYYENRANRADVYPKRKIKLEDGGEAKIESRQEMLLTIADMMRDHFKFTRLKDNDYVFLDSDFDDFESGDYESLLGDVKDGVLKIRNRDNTLLLDKNDDYHITLNGKKLGTNDLFKEGDKYFFAKNNEYLTFKKNGQGMMWLDKDGEVSIATHGMDSSHFVFMFDDKKDWDNYQPRIFHFFKRAYYEDGGMMMADGGMAGHGRRMSTGGVVLNLYTTGADWKMNMAKQKDFDDYKSARKAGDKSGAFEYEIVDEITGDVIYSTHSEKMTPSLAYKDGGMANGKHYVGRFTEAQLKNKEDEKAIEKAQKETGLKYIDTKMVKKAGKIVAMDVYLIDEETYLKQPLMAKGGKTKSKKFEFQVMFYDGAGDLIDSEYYVDDPSDKEVIELAKKLDAKTGQLYRDKYESGEYMELVADYDFIDEYADGGNTEDDWEVLQVRPRKKKAKTQGYDDRKDESLGMSRGKTASKDLDGTKKEKEKSRRDDAGFETRKKRGRKKHIYSWKPEAKGKVPISALKKTPSEYYAKKFPNLVNLEKQ